MQKSMQRTMQLDNATHNATYTATNATIQPRMQHFSAVSFPVTVVLPDFARDSTLAPLLKSVQLPGKATDLNKQRRETFKLETTHHLLMAY
jgi:hypothetical protein